MEERIVIVGSGGDARECLDVIEAVNRQFGYTFEFLGFVDDETQSRSAHIEAETIGRRVAKLNEFEAGYVIGLGDPIQREEIDRTALREPSTLVHPAATLAADAVIGGGTVLMAGARLSSRTRLGRHVRVDHNATVSHDAVLGDYVTVRPGANISREVVLEDGVTVAAGAVVIHGCRVGRGAIVGAGAVVINDVPAGMTVAGVPAKPIVRK